jgi:hypothetical protein
MCAGFGGPVTLWDRVRVPKILLKAYSLKVPSSAKPQNVILKSSCLAATAMSAPTSMPEKGRKLCAEIPHSF